MFSREKNIRMCRIAERFLLRCLPFVLVAAAYTLTYILKADEYTLYMTRSLIFDMMRCVCLSLALCICGALFADMNIKSAERR